MSLKKLLRHDEILLKKLNQNLNCTFLDILMPIITYLGSLTFCIIICIPSFYIFHDSIIEFPLPLALSLILSTLVCQIIKHSVNRLRPFLIIENLNIKKIGIDDYSLPSGHTTAAFCIAISLSILLPKFTLLFFVLALLVGLSRVYLGVHYPTDVLLGIVIGCVCSILVRFFL